MELPRTKLKILGLIFKVATNLTEVWRNKRILSLNVSFPVSETKLSGEFKTAYTLYVPYTFPYKKNNNHVFFSVALQPGNITETAQYDEIYEFILPVPR